ncbi:hypothetical protein DET65_4166 [Sunxiuqinia elliptica]|uniref:Uncharacterized protein n=1 Tax=Sunxiuqinia elliptica TaxID=655355 RepID=A0A4R6GUN1_9BACT|nr:hypothetical protein DET52_107301 [Sunxiuqinia elliptica]TDO56609.1 hypothetical protein DET65_4166 [Sunxiuqinia elliptica]
MFQLAYGSRKMANGSKSFANGVKKMASWSQNGAN